MHICVFILMYKNKYIYIETNDPYPATSQPANQPASQPTSQPANQPTNQPTSQPTNQPASQPANQPATSHHPPPSQPSHR